MTTASDDFNRANETPVGSPWAAARGGGLNLASNALVSTASTAKASVYNSGTWGDDQRVDVTVGNLIGSTTYAEAWVRGSTSGNGYIAYTDGTTGGTAIARVDAGSETLLQAVSVAFSNGDVLGIGIVETTITLYKNGVAQTPTTTDSTYSSGLPGCGAYGAATVDDWTADDGAAAATVDQAAFRFGADDGSESGHTWLETQGTDHTRAVGSAFLLRFLLQATGDPASFAPTLYAAKNGGSYAPVPVGASQVVAPIIEAGDVTESGNNTATTSWAVSYPAYVSGDLLVFHVASDANVTHDWPATGPNGETINTIQDSVGGTAQRASAFWFVGSATTSSGTLTVTPSATEQWTAAVLKVPAGEFNSTTPIQSNSGTANDTTANNAASTPTWTADATAGGRVVVWFAIDTVEATAAPSGWQIVASEDRGAVGGTLGIRDAANTASESIASADFTIANETDTSIGYIINGVTVTNELYIAASSNIADTGEDTTSRLTGGTGSFTTGRRWDDENGTDTIDLALDNNTEVEWSLNTQSPAENGYYWDFQVYSGSTELSAYDATPRLTLGTASTPSSTPRPYRSSSTTLAVLTYF